MKLKLSIPVEQYDAISNSIKDKFNDLTPKQEKKIIETTYSLFVYILNYKENKDHKYADGYKHIFRKNMLHFQFKLNNKCYHYSDIIGILERANQIDVFTAPNKDWEYKQRYKVGEFPKSYRIIDNNYNNSDIREIEVDINLVFSKNKSHKELLKEHENDYTISNVLINYAKLDINIIAFSKFIAKYKNKLYKKEISRIKTGDNWVTSTKKTYMDTIKITDLIVKSVKIKENIYFISRSQEGRIYSSFTNLPKIIKPFIYEKGKKNEKLKEIDIANCQPGLLAYLFVNEEYKKIVEAGDYYKHFGDGNAKKMKDKNMFILFGKTKLSDTSIQLLSKIDGLADFINEFRNVSERNQEMFHILQSMESHIFIDLVSKYCIENNITFFTVHDSIMVSEKRCDEVYNYIKKVIMDEYGLDLFLRVKSQDELLLDVIAEFDRLEKIEIEDNKNKFKN